MPGPNTASPAATLVIARTMFFGVVAFEDVAESAGADCGEDGIVVVEHGEHENGDFRSDAGDLAGRCDSGAAGHADVHHEDVGVERDGGADRLVAGGGGAHQFVAVDGGDEPAESFTDDGVVVGDHDADGHRAASGRVTVTRPPVASAGGAGTAQFRGTIAHG